MDQKINDGGSAFPVTQSPVMNNGESAVYPEVGMSLRDYFAAKAMTGILSQWTEFNRSAGTSRPTEHRISHLAMRSYDIADAMLRARAEADARSAKPAGAADRRRSRSAQTPTVDHHGKEHPIL